MPPLIPSHRWLVSLVALFATGLPALAADDPEGIEFFEKRVRPILVDHCYKCHSAGRKIKGELRLDSRQAVLKGGKTRPAIVPGDPEKSLLIEAVRYKNPDLQMPPKEQLTAGQVADLVAWIKRGAPDPRDESTIAKPADDIAAARQRWPYTPLAVPQVPEVKEKSWPRNDIDRFILAKLESAGLQHAAPADKRTLIRRASYDLTGLPPAPADVQAFLNDDTPEAFARVTDRLLASPAYGQRYARYWLDLVRYTDSFDARGQGGPMDCAEAWRYRDWVVNAFNANLPYDQFVRAQIAGDLMEASGFTVQGSGKNSALRTRDSGLPLVATTVYGIGNWGGGDADKEKLLTDIADDQIDLTGRAFLGLTLACARCHDHKFDPISTEDYYGLAGIFFSSHILPNVGPKTNGPDMLKIPIATKEELAQREQAKKQLAALEAELEQRLDQHYKTLAQQVLPQVDRYLAAAQSCAKDHADTAAVARQQNLDVLVLRRFAQLLTQADLNLLQELSTNIHNVPGVCAFHHAGKADTPSATINPTNEKVSFITITMPAHSVAVHPSPKGAVSVLFRSPIAGRVIVSASVGDADPNCGDGVDYTLTHRSAALAKGAINNGGKSTLPPKPIDLAEGDAVELIIGPKADYSCDTTLIDLRIEEQEGQHRTWRLTHDLAFAAPTRNPAPDIQGHQNVWHFVDRLNAPTEPLMQMDAGRRAEFINNPRSGFWSPLRTDDGSLAPEERAQISDLRSEISNLKSSLATPIPTTHGLQEGGCPASPHAGVHDVAIHIRGRYDRLGPVVPRRFPRLLARDEDQPAIKQGSGRTELANWIASPKNPLTARVMANRLWQWHFGEGIVRTPNNFGKLGTPPTHPELLDYLATQLIQSGWSIKQMHRQIMLSATYQQSAASASNSNDPDNLLLCHVNRRRLDAESLRDAMLAATGELDLTQGGPANKDLNSPRRTLYLMTTRSDRTGYRMLFDAADPTAIIDKRIDSTVAPQALFLMNHPFITARAKKLAAQSASSPHSIDPDRIDWLYQTLFARPATDEERSLAERFIKKKGPTAWDEYCHVLLCSNEFVYVD